ncbi:YjjG family noncanonical pyrimidine nucleotidase [Peredibacter starrii]|uniref:YjjG family noncanonical pyrimidine nucleotidase n=1 Tax=Peredibacter starrii TaxID=28202 RepID=A0AAX4HMP7_9BACT|nr:YjjG family noncanonical pyrimidine nucleotidase [Peredibacter starrii]WPU64558.1 YjjG family noncanonical pyrimidine nucleotidase [Peredibacter starrii]
MKYNLFLFDLDDTLLDFKASERLSFFLALKSLGIQSDLENLFSQYQVVNTGLWKLFEEAKVTKEHLKVERFRKIFEANGLGVDPNKASERYLETLPETVVLMDHAVEICEWLKGHGEIGIITNGIQTVQHQRIKNSLIAPYISFISVSDECGFAKPDVRFFEYTAKKVTNFNKLSSIIVGDREEADIQGARNFGIDSCWFNPHQKISSVTVTPTYEIKHLSELKHKLTNR